MQRLVFGGTAAVSGLAALVIAITTVPSADDGDPDAAARLPAGAAGKTNVSGPPPSRGPGAATGEGEAVWRPRGSDLAGHLRETQAALAPLLEAEELDAARIELVRAAADELSRLRGSVPQPPSPLDRAEEDVHARYRAAVNALHWGVRDLARGLEGDDPGRIARGRFWLGEGARRLEEVRTRLE